MDLRRPDLLEVLRAFVELQLRLIGALKDRLGARDWHFLLDVPKRGTVECDGEAWQYKVHGTGIRFEGDLGSIDANRDLDRFPGAFDAGRLVEYLRSQGAAEVYWRGRVYAFDYDEGPALLRKLSEAGDISRVHGVDGDLYLV